MNKFLLFLCISTVFFACSKTPVSTGTDQSASVKTFSTEAGLSLASMEKTSDGGFIFSGHALKGAGQKDAGFLMKTDANGNELWRKFYGDSGTNVFSMAHQTSDGGYIAVGYTTGLGHGAARKDYYPDGWIVKTDANGNLTWQRTYGDIYYDDFVDVQEIPHIGFVAVGTIQQYNSFDYLYVDEFWLEKTDFNGNNSIGHVAFTSYFSCDAKSVALAPDGTVGIAGRISSSSSPGWYYHPVFLRISADCNTLLDTALWAFSTDPLMKLKGTSSGFILGLHENHSNSISTDLIKLDSHGDILWQKYYPESLSFSNVSNGPKNGYTIIGDNSSGIQSAQATQVDTNGNTIAIANCPVTAPNALHGATTTTINSVPTATGWAFAVSVTPTFIHRNSSFALIFTDQNGKIIENGK